MSSAETPIRALIFDMDGLLVDSEELSRKAVHEFLARYARVPTSDLDGKLLGRRIPEAMQLLIEEYALPGEVSELGTAFEALRLATIRGNLRPMPGAAALIAFGRAAGLRLGLATSNLRAQVDLSLAETALAGLFDAEATGDEVERGKPEPDLFLLVAERLGVEPEACLVLEDAPAGIAAAEAAGMRRILVLHVMSADLHFSAEPTAVLLDLAAVIPWLEARGVVIRA